MREELQAAVDDANRKFARIEQVKKFTMLERDLSQEHEELTPTLKVKRNVVYERYEDEFTALYDAGGTRRAPPADRPDARPGAAPAGPGERAAASYAEGVLEHPPRDRPRDAVSVGRRPPRDHDLRRAHDRRAGRARPPGADRRALALQRGGPRDAPGAERRARRPGVAAARARRAAARARRRRRAARPARQRPPRARRCRSTSRARSRTSWRSCRSTSATSTSRSRRRRRAPRCATRGR